MTSVFMLPVYTKARRLGTGERKDFAGARLNQLPMPMPETSCDLLVCGGGIAGIAAALEASRAGLRVALLEKTLLPGGLATSGLVFVYLPLCDGKGTQVTFGIAEELLHLSYKYGPGDVPNWREIHTYETRFRVTFSPGSFVLALDEALVDAGVDIWYDTLVCLPLLEDDRLVGVEVETKRGRERLVAPCVVDATGDADLAYRAGAPCVPGTNLLSIWALQASLAAARKAVEREDGTALISPFHHGGDNEPPPAIPTGDHLWLGNSAQDVTGFALGSRRVYREHLAALQAQGGETSRQNLWPITLPTQAQYRHTRRIDGLATMRGGEEWLEREDSVGLVADWREAGKVWEVPYGALLPQGVRGLLVAGRCMASDGDSWHVMRVIPAAAATGQAAGVAATLAVQQGTTPDAVPASAIQAELTRQGIPYHWRPLYKSST